MPSRSLVSRFKKTRAPQTAPGASSRGDSSRGAAGDGAPRSGAPEGWAYKPGETPAVLQGRYEFTRSFSDLAKGKRNWQLVAFASLALLGLALVGLVGVSLQSKTVPYVVEVDRLGRVEAITPADAVPAASDRVVVASLARFVADIRTVYADPVAQRDAVFRAYGYVAGDARTFLEDYFSEPENDPRLLAAEMRRSVEIVSVIPVPVPGAGRSGAAGGARPYRVRWNETSTSERAGTSVRAWEGYFTVEVQPPTSTEAVQRNPLGVFVTALSWSALAGDAPAADVPTDEGAPASAALGTDSTARAARATRADSSAVPDVAP